MDSKFLYADGSLESAKEFAAVFHGKQYYGFDVPYTTHLDEVEAVLAEHGYERLHDKLVARLHDVVEDTMATRSDIEQRWGPAVAQDVDACTGVGYNRKSRNASILAKLIVHPNAAKYKAADRIANLRRTLSERNFRTAAMYLEERFAFCEVVIPRLKRPTLAQALNDAYEAVSQMVREEEAAYDWTVQDTAIDKFAAKLKAKLRKKAPERGHGWIEPDEIDAKRFQTMLADHVLKGDPVDVGLFAMMIDYHGMTTA